MRNKRKKDKVLRIFIVLIILIIGIYFGYNKLLNNHNNISSDSKVNVDDNNHSTSISLIMAGDNLINDKLYNAAKKDDGSYDFKSMYSYIKDIVKNYDLAYYNQETILGGSEIGVSSYPAFNSPYEVGDATIDTGFNLVSLATNHTLDRGEKAIINSLNYWNNKSNVLTSGSYLSNNDRNKVNIKEVNNITYTMLNYTYGTNGIKVPEGKEYLVNIWPCTGNNPDNDTKYQEYKEVVKEDILRVRDKVDLLIVAMHFGVEYTHVPTKYQIDMAEFLSSLGVDIIIGTHPHVIMPITYINDTLVIYSLGNFLSAQDTNNDYNTTVGLLSSIKITKNIDKDNNSSIKLSDLNNELIYTTNKDGYKIIPFSNPDIKDYLNDYERVYNKYANIVRSIDSSININSLS
ncbi:MAG: CapA family protein [Bacilli bacterium]|nr:CapA family protein [Bacilli bacterium]